MKWALIVSAVSEAGAGLSFLLVPSLVGRLLFSAELAGVGTALVRLIGIALVALAVACWPDRDMLRAFSGMLTYSLVAMLYLVYLGVNGVTGILLWPAAAAHAGLSALLLRAWRKKRRASEAGR